MGRPSFTRAMVEISSENSLKEKVVVAIPKFESTGYNRCEIKVDYEWKPPRCSLCKVFGHTDANCQKKNKDPKEAKVNGEGFQQAKTKKNKGFNVGPPKYEYRPKTKIVDQSGPSNTCENSFEMLNKIGNPDVDGDIAVMKAKDLQIENMEKKKWWKLS